MFEILRKALLAGLGAQEKAKEFIEDLVKKGELSQSEGAKLMKEVMERMEKGSEEMDKMITEAVHKALQKLDLPTRQDIIALEEKLKTLSERLEKVEGSGQG